MRYHPSTAWLPSSIRRLAGTLLILVAMAVPWLEAAESAGPTADLRALGHLTSRVRYVGEAPERSSWITLEAADPARAAACASKYLADLLGYGDVHPITDQALPGTGLALDGSGQWLLGLDGPRVQVVFARTPAALATILQQAGAARWRPVTPDRHPRWMDLFDNDAVTFWFSGFGILPKDLPADRRWYADHGFSACAVLGNTERRLIAPGMLDTSVMDWQSQQAAAYHTPYKIMADMATPARPESLWNRLPLPYYLPDADGQLASSRLGYQNLAVHAAFQAGAVSDPWLMDFRRRVAARLTDDPWFIGHHVIQEMPGGGPGDLSCLAAVAGTPGIQQLWRVYLRDVLHLDLATVGSKHQGSPTAYRDWSAVAIPPLKDFLGWGPGAIDLTGIWEGRADRDRQAEAEHWQDGNDSDRWRPVECHDLTLMLYGEHTPCDYYLRRTFTVPAGGSPSPYLHLARPGDGPTSFDVWINGRKLAVVSNTDPSCPDWDICLDAGAALRPGSNRIVINTRGVPIAGYAFLSAQGRWTYPGPSPVLNRRFFDLLGFEEWLVMRELENRMIAIRAGDPYRPMKVMAPHNYIDRVLDLCRQYGAYPHDTGGAGAWWGPFTYARYASTRGVPNSVEEGNVPHDAAEMQAVITRYLMMGADAVDNVGHVSAYTGNPGIAAWIDGNRELLRCVGKQDLVQPAVGLLRCGRELRFGNSDMYAWDMGRGPLPSIGRAFAYATFGDLREGGADRFKVLLDCATAVMSEDEVGLIERYVRQGGTFVAFHNTGVHTPEQAYAWPISRLTGLRVVNGNRTIGGTPIHFGDHEDLWPRLRGQEVDGWGLVLDWLKQDRTGTPVSLAADGSDIEVVATWKNGPPGGNIAVASRRLGKGRVITLGSTFYRNGKDDAGRYSEPGTLPYLDELLTSLGVPRETAAGSLWSEHWRSKNGIYDIYPVCQMDPHAAKASTDVSVRRETPSASVRELSAAGHPALPVRMDGGMMTIPQVAMTAMQTRVFATPRADIEAGVLHWLEVQQRQSGALAEIPAGERERATLAAPADVIALADGWRCTTGDVAASWTAPDDTTSAGWKPVRLGAFATMGLPEDAVARFRTEVRLPAAWTGQRVSLRFDAEHWFWGITWRGALWINGVPAVLPRPLQPQPDACFTLPLTPEQTASGRLVLALEVDGRRPDPANRDQARPSGVTGTFLLLAAPQPVQTTPLTAWSAASDVGVLAATTVGSRVSCMYLETRFTLPAAWPGKRLFLRAPVPLGCLFINNRYIAAPEWMTELDISGLVAADGENTLRWVPDRPSPAWDQPYTGTVPAAELLWLP